MFIDIGSMVSVRDTAAREDLRGRFGMVSKIRIISHSSAVLVFVELYDPVKGDCPVMMFEPDELERRKNTETTLNCPLATDELHKIKFMELAAAA
jgi:hypothetical protein